MAGNEQQERKPKTTLIKHRRSEQSPSQGVSETEKRRVVVKVRKRSGKPKPAGLAEERPAQSTAPAAEQQDRVAGVSHADDGHDGRAVEEAEAQGQTQADAPDAKSPAPRGESSNNSVGTESASAGHAPASGAFQTAESPHQRGQGAMDEPSGSPEPGVGQSASGTRRPAQASDESPSVALREERKSGDAGRPTATSRPVRAAERRDQGTRQSDDSHTDDSGETSPGVERAPRRRPGTPPDDGSAAPPDASTDDSSDESAPDGKPRVQTYRPEPPKRKGPRKAGIIGGRPVGRPPQGTRPSPAEGLRTRTTPGGPPRPPRPTTGRPPVGGRPDTRRPVGGRPVGGNRPSGGPPPSDADAAKRPTHKKFIKKKTRDSYQRRERAPEKEIQLKNRKSLTPRANPVPKSIDIMEVVTVSELARKMNLKASELIGKLMSMGMMVTINQQIDKDTATLLAQEYDCSVNIVSLYDETIIDMPRDSEGDLEFRPPIVTIMGHVDHGKTKLLDTVRSANVVAGEFGGITQHIGAYQVATDGGKITFLDTPGHEAFTLMRARGAQITDIVVLVVAANDGVMPQTEEAINHAKAAGVPIIVAINKIDLPDANIDRVKQQLADFDLMAEDWGGQTITVPVSALKGEGVSDLLDSILVQAEVMELRANRNTRAEGRIIESRIDPGRGTVCSVLIERGTLQVGDPFVSGVYPGRVRALFDDRGQRVSEAGPSMPVEVIGATGVPAAGDPFQVTQNERAARQVGDKRQELQRVEAGRNVKKITLETIYDETAADVAQELKVIIKADVHGSVEALRSALEKLSTGEVRLVPIHAAAGAINENDVMLASASNASIIGFHVRPTGRAQELAEREKVEIRKYSVIYDVIDDIRDAMEGMLSPDLREESVGQVEVRDTFKVPKIGVIAGCYVLSGHVRRNAMVRVYRDDVELHAGKVSSLRRFKDDARQVDAGYECGIGIENYNDLQVGDRIEVFEVREIAKKLGASK